MSLATVRAALSGVDRSEIIGEDLVWGGEAEVEGTNGLVLVDSQPGAEGGGENIWVVFKEKGDDDHLYRLQGYYSSYDGSNWEEMDVEEVEAYEVTVTRYRAKK